MDIFEAIERRHCYRAAFLDEAVPREDLRRIVEAGIRAPSGCNGQTTTFVIVDDADTLAQIRALAPGKPHIDTAPAMIVCAIEPRPVYEEMSFEVEDCAAAVENMLLAIEALGYATVWIDGMLRRDGRAEALAELLDVPEGRQVRIILPLGRPAKRWAQREKKPFEERAWFNRHGA